MMAEKGSTWAPTLIYSTLLWHFLEAIPTGRKVEKSELLKAFDYSDQEYEQLKAEYIEDFMAHISTTTMRRIEMDSVEHTSSQRLRSSKTAASPKITAAKDYTEIQQEFHRQSNKLGCDFPYWFPWRVFQCVLLDLRHRHYSPRLKKNLIVSAIILAILFALTCGASVYVYCYVRLHFALLFQSYKKIGQKYTRFEKPGAIRLLNGEIRHYPPSKEEYEALEELMTVMATVD